MAKKIQPQISLSIVLLCALMAVLVIFQCEKNSWQLAGPARSSSSQAAVPEPVASPQTVFEGRYSLARYGVEKELFLPAGIVANDYGDGLAQLAIKQRTNGEGKLAYDGGFPVVMVKISEDCRYRDVTYLCSQFEQLSQSAGADIWEISRIDKGETKKIRRKNLFAFEDDFFEDYYVKLGNLVVTVSYDKSPHAAYVLDEMKGQTLPTLPEPAVEEKQVKELANSLVGQLD